METEMGLVRLKPDTPLLVFCQDEASIAGSGVLKASAITVLSSISPFR